MGVTPVCWNGASVPLMGIVVVTQLIRANGEPWSTGSAPFLSNVQHATPDGRVVELVSAVHIRIGQLDQTLALFDTASTWSVIGPDIFSALDSDELDLLDDGPTLSTRFGCFETHFVRVPVTFTADFGSDLSMEATLLYVPEWTHVPVVGHRGLLERVRFAVEPGKEEDRFYFALQTEH